jgi:hypothetical protein
MPQKSPTMQARNELQGQIDCVPHLWSAIVQRESQPMLARPRSLAAEFGRARQRRFALSEAIAKP